MDLNKDHKLTFEEFKEGSKQDPTIVQVSQICSFGLLIAGSVSVRWPGLEFGSQFMAESRDRDVLFHWMVT